MTWEHNLYYMYLMRESSMDSPHKEQVTQSFDDFFLISISKLF